MRSSKVLKNFTREQKFLNKLASERKLELIEPSQEICRSYLEKSRISTRSAKVLLDNALLETSIAMSYYSMYHTLTALFYAVGIKCENHSAAIIIMKEVFGLDDSLIKKAKAERIDQQYTTTFKVNSQQVAKSIKIAEKFYRELVGFIDYLDSTKISEFKKRFKNLLLIK